MIQIKALQSQKPVNDLTSQFLYLKQAFLTFVTSSDVNDIQHLGRVICTILEYNETDAALIASAIVKFAPAMVTASAIDSFSSGLTSFFERSLFS